MGHNAHKLEREAQALLAPFGLVAFGWFTTAEGKPALLLGNVGSSLWPAFSKSPFFEDEMPDPMNRWTESVVGEAASKLGAQARYPFGETVWPFQRWAKAATRMQQSPIGLLIHPKFGLWCAFRAVLVFDEAFAVPAPKEAAHPCNDCADKPCLKTCPVEAFAVGAYDVAACRTHISSSDGEICKTGGCRARLSCPVGRDNAYLEAQQAFHMAAFL